MCSIIGLLASGIMGLGLLEVSGRSRVPFAAGHDHGLHGRTAVPGRVPPRRPRPSASARRASGM